MALNAVVLLLWGFAVSAHAASFCNVSCSTDYKTSVNCSCSGSPPTHPVSLNVSCSEEGTQVEGSCIIEAPQLWCTTLNEILEEVASVSTDCTTTVSVLGGSEITHPIESLRWRLSNMVKTHPPSDVKVMSAGELYNISWSNNSTKRRGCFTYGVRIQPLADLLKRPADVLQADRGYILQVDEAHVLLDKKLLQHVGASIDVRAKLCSTYHLQGPWSEWSSSVELPAADSQKTGGMSVLWLYVSLPMVLVLGLLLLGYLQKPFWLKKLKMITYIPRPDDFFKPLDADFGGNFKEWVKPVFNEFDYVPFSKKNYDILRWNHEVQTFSKDGETKEGSQFLSVPQPPSMLQDVQEMGSSEGHSTGHISIHTVTIYGESFGEEDTSQSSLRSFRDGESFGSFEDASRDGFQEPQATSRTVSPREDQLADDLLVEDMNYEPEAELLEAERASLDSFGSNMQSEDGYPHVDLDTMDSGFGECSSPGVSDSNRPELLDSFTESKTLNSNYVKQWMICRTIQEDGGRLEDGGHLEDGGRLEDELNRMQKL